MTDATLKGRVGLLQALEMLESMAAEQPMHSLRERLRELSTLSVEEGVPWRECSSQSALAFAAQHSPLVRPDAFLVGNGNIRLLYGNATHTAGLQFLCDGDVQYVLSRQTHEEEHATFWQGAATVNRLLRTLHLQGFGPLLQDSPDSA